MSGEKDSQIFDEPWANYPHLFARKASGGKWVPYAHLRYISTAIAPALLNGDGRFIVTIPPRHGKSELISNWLPTWFLYNCPQKRVILASYAADFATKWGAKVKENLTNNRLIATGLSKDTKAKKKFATLEGGQMICAGVGGPITGEGADCVPAGTMVQTDHGPMDIALLVKRIELIKVLAYNHSNGQCEYKRIQAAKSRKVDRIFEIKFNSGRSIRATGNHPIFIQGFGYKKAKDIRQGDIVFTTKGKDTVSMVSEICSSSIEVYDIQVEDFHNFFANEILIHNCFIIDDPIKNYQDAMSDLVRERHKDWYRSVVRTRLEPGASVVLLQTRWHESDLAGWLISDAEREEDENRKPWTVINMPAICDDPANDPLGRQLGDALCPERFNKQKLAEIEADLEGMIWSALYQQRPTAMKGNIILKEWIKYYDQAPTSFDEEAIFADLTFKEGTTTDFTVIECWGRKGANIFLLDQIRARMGFPDQIASIRAMAARRPNAYIKQIEEAANGAAVIEMLKNEIMGLVPVKPHTSKQARLAAVSPLYEAGNVHYPNPKYSKWVETNISELLTFPNAKHDDTCLASGTLISTWHGDLPIEDIKIGELVWTPLGLRKVLWSGQTGNKECINKYGMRATHGHPIFCKEKGFIPVDSGSMAMVDFLSWNTLVRWTVLKSWFSMGSSFVSWEGKKSITSVNQLPMLEEKMQSVFTLLFMKLLRERKYQKVITFTIKTLIRLIIILVIWNVYRSKNIMKHIREDFVLRSRGLICKISGRKLLRGIKVQKASSYINGLDIVQCQSDKSKNINVLFAIMSFIQNLLQNTVQPIAVIKWHGCPPLWKLQYVLFAKRPLKEKAGHIKIEQEKHVPPLAEPEAVYNLTVEDAHCFYANGILVGNCDTASMAVTYLGKMNNSIQRLEALAKW